MKLRIAAAAAIVIVLGGIIAYLHFSDTLAQWVWERWGWGAGAVLLDRHDAPLALEIGMDNFGPQDYDLSVALPAFEKAVAIEPGILWGHYEIARILFVEDDLPGALVQINLELHYNPENLRSLYVRALIEGYEGDFADAETDLYRFVAWVPTEWAGYNDLGWVLSSEEKYAAAEQVIDQAFAHARGASTNPWLWNTLGEAQLNQGQYSDALVSFQKALVLAQAMTVEQWQEAYPGDSPGSESGGLFAFRAAIAQNLAQAQANVDK